MKKCPTCSKTFDDNLKFCQADGTPLVEDKPEDPYKTMVAKRSDLQIPPEKPKEEVKPPEPVAVTPAPEPKPEPPPPAAAPEQKVAPAPPAAPESKPPVASEPKPEPPAEAELDPMRTMMISGNTRDNVRVDIPEESPRKEGSKKEEQKVEAPKVAPSAPTPELEIDSTPKVKEAGKPAPPAPELPKFDSPDVAPPVLESTNLDAKLKEKVESNSLPTPPSKPPTAELPKADTPSKPGGDVPSTPKIEVKDKPSVPIPSPFDKSMPPGYAPPSTPPFDPTEPVKAEKVGSIKKSGTDDWSPPAAPMGEWKDKEIGSNEPSGSAAAPADGLNKTLAIVSLVCGVLSMTLCCGPVGLLLGPVGAITGFMARSKANQEPTVYGGSGLALGGLITGIVGFIVSIVALVAYFVLNLGAAANF